MTIQISKFLRSICRKSLVLCFSLAFVSFVGLNTASAQQSTPNCSQIRAGIDKFQKLYNETTDPRGKCQLMDALVQLHEQWLAYCTAGVDPKLIRSVLNWLNCNRGKCTLPPAQPTVPPVTTRPPVQPQPPAQPQPPIYQPQPPIYQPQPPTSCPGGVCPQPPSNCPGGVCYPQSTCPGGVCPIQ